MQAAEQPVADAPPRPPRGLHERTPSGHEVIEVKLRDLHQLFDSLDPSPFHERDLDDDAAAYVLGWVHDFPTERPYRLRIHVATPPHLAQPDVATAVQNYFIERAHQARRQLRELLRRGRKSLVIGLAFLCVCSVAAQLLGRFEELFLARILQEGITVAGWVALWRPLEIFLYDWWPVREDQRLFARLAEVAVEVVLDPPAAPAASPSAASRPTA